jgi:hypothetical protein
MRISLPAAKKKKSIKSTGLLLFSSCYHFFHSTAFRTHSFYSNNFQKLAIHLWHKNRQMMNGFANTLAKTEKKIKPNYSRKQNLRFFFCTHRAQISRLKYSVPRFNNKSFIDFAMLAVMNRIKPVLRKCIHLFSFLFSFNGKNKMKL